MSKPKTTQVSRTTPRKRSANRAAPLRRTPKSSSSKATEHVVETLSKDIKVVITGKNRSRAGKTKSADAATTMVAAAAKALSKPGGVKRDVIFRTASAGKSKTRIAAYSIDPTDPTVFIREFADGTRSAGRVIGGRFKALRTLRRKKTAAG